MTLPTWTKAEAALSVAINGAYLPFREVPKAMERFVRPAVFSTGDERFELQVFGTAFMAEYKGLRFAVTTRHQASGRMGVPSADKFVVVVQHEGKRLVVPPSDLHRTTIDDPGRQSMADLMFYDYSISTPQVKTQHLDLCHISWSDTQGVSSDYSFLIGFPTSSAKITLDESDDPRLIEYTLRWIRQDLELAELAPMDPPDRTIFIKHPRSTRMSIEPDGLSGSPVFSVVADTANERHLRFDGIVTHARGDRFAVYPSGVVRDLLDSIVARTEI